MNNSRFITNTRSTIHRKNYPVCKENSTNISRQIFLAPCYAADGSKLTELCYALVVPGGSTRSRPTTGTEDQPKETPVTCSINDTYIDNGQYADSPTDQIPVGGSIYVQCLNDTKGGGAWYCGSNGSLSGTPCT